MGGNALSRRMAEGFGYMDCVSFATTRLAQTIETNESGYTHICDQIVIVQNGKMIGNGALLKRG